MIDVLQNGSIKTGATMFINLGKYMRICHRFPAVATVVLFLVCIHSTNCFSGQLEPIKIDLKVFSTYFNLSDNSDSVDDYVAKYSKKIVQLTPSQLNEIVINSQGDYQKAKALLMLTVLNLNHNITDTSVSKNYYDLYYHDLSSDLWITLLLK
ncbi:hypothetical protein [Mucilaginibacter ginsenosidivorax]|uniref:Uncharacterized protein n=1 Tax=Mucilaginibacter ginsenosidivorax TaxID=862126 RepID=A0A5B8W649_9SPHI|nr:hypothetical protein [Mucilaginibacter ginsenosidivorax]QEC79344.1 hypothetical protein FSB76_26595 [Mucilaginibacter ginsenosidivorax]